MRKLVLKHCSQLTVSSSKFENRDERNCLGRDTKKCSTHRENIFPELYSKTEQTDLPTHSLMTCLSLTKHKFETGGAGVNIGNEVHLISRELKTRFPLSVCSIMEMAMAGGKGREENQIHGRFVTHTLSVSLLPVSVRLVLFSRMGWGAGGSEQTLEIVWIVRNSSSLTPAPLSAALLLFDLSAFNFYFWSQSLHRRSGHRNVTALYFHWLLSPQLRCETVFSKDVPIRSSYCELVTTLNLAKEYAIIGANESYAER
ncbi:hypothetical protein J6590_066418 [Homalodisca vitripennis]|nr:hypothetical protein J6590_066418 [Homalodisca vitripennis]